MYKYPKGASKECSRIILNQMEKSVLTINGKNIGFFCNIRYDNKIIPCLITSYKVIDELYITNNTYIEVKINEEIKKIEFGRNYYFDEIHNITIIEIKENKDIEIIFSDLDENIYEKEIDNNYYKQKSIYTIYLGQNKNVKVSYGIINYSFKSEIIYSCNIDSKSECSLIFNLSTNKIIGIYTKPSKIYNKGIFLKFIVDEFIKEYQYSKHDKNNKNINDEIDILINVEKKDINKEIYFLAN